MLSEVADTLRIPPSVSDEKAKGGKKINVLFQNDLPSVGYISDASKTITLKKETQQKIEKYFLQPFDVVISIAGNVGSVSIMPEEVTGLWIATNTLLAIRFTEKQRDNAIAFAMFLKSPYGKDLIDSIAVGKTVQRINVKDISGIQIPELTPEVKKSSKAAFNKEEKLYNKIVEFERTILGDVRGKYLVSE